MLPISFGKLFLAIGIGVIIAVAAWFFLQLRGGDDAEPSVGDDNGEVAQNTVEINGQQIAIDPDPAVRLILQTELGQQQPETPVTQITEEPTLEENTQTEEPPPEQQATPEPTAEPPPTDPPPEPTAVPDTGVSTVPHFVVQGQTPFQLTQLYNTDLDLLAAHGITPATLKANTTIQVPVYGAGGTANVNCASGRSHIVQQGDNLFRIALNNNTDYNTLASLNGLADPTCIKIGQVICLP